MTNTISTNVAGPHVAASDDKFQAVETGERTAWSARNPPLDPQPHGKGCPRSYLTFAPASCPFMLWLLSAALLAMVGCGGRIVQKQNREFFTSGSREADQRASQRMAKEEQLAGSGEGAGEKGVKKAVPAKPSSGAATAPGETNKAAQVEGKLALFDRLGAEKGIVALIEDFTPRVLQDPRVNWQRKGMKRGGFSIHRGKSVTWNASPENVTQL